MPRPNSAEKRYARPGSAERSRKGVVPLKIN